MMLRLALALLTLTLAGCGSLTPWPDWDSRSPGQASRPGGFYKDDGPGDNPPANLDKIPDAVPRNEPPHRFANRPYSVLGNDYVPLRPGAPYRATGMASWYGRKFHGQKTSTGEIYDMYAMTAAHPTLPIPSYARVTNPANKKSVVVRVNDRGPFLHNRIIDLSYAAAWKLGYVGSGSTHVLVESIATGQETAPGPIPINDVVVSRVVMAEQAPPSLPEISDTRGVYLQLGAFSSAENAENLRSRLARELGGLAKRLAVFPGDGMFRVRLGPWTDHNEARRVADELAELLDFRPIVVQR
jgi:rare lipoprotein A